MKGTNVHLEVTGPLSKSVDAGEPLWVRPDKVERARAHYPDIDMWIVHCLAKDGTKRAIRVDGRFLRRKESGAFETVYPEIRGARETYLAIPATDPCVRPFDDLIQHLKSLD